MNLLLQLLYVLLLGLGVFRLRRAGRARSIPGVAVSLGIAFTFVGIFIAMLGFDVGDVAGSIPRLLGGMRLAFATSIAGMAVAVVYRLTSDSPFWGPAEQDVADPLLTRGEFLQAQEAASARQVQAYREVVAELAEAHQAALGEVVARLQHHVAAPLAVQVDRLGAAADQLVRWQASYRDEVSAVLQQVHTTLAAVRASEDAVDDLLARSERFAEAAGLLRDVLAAVQTETSRLEDDLGALARVRDRATEALPTLEAHLDHLTASAARRIDALTARIEHMADTQAAAFEEVVAEVRARPLAPQAPNASTEELASMLRLLTDQLHAARPGAAHSERRFPGDGGGEDPPDSIFLSP